MFTLESQNNTPFQKKKKYYCPACKKNNKFTRYINQESKEYIDDNVGICDRADNCGFHYTPKQYFTDNNLNIPKTNWTPKKTNTPLPVSYIPLQILKSTLKKYESNNFVCYLNSIFDTEKVNSLITKYNLGTSKMWGGGSTIFWQVDSKSLIRSGKIILYNELTGSRTKNITWVHSLLKINNFNLNQCLFGEHLTNGNTKTIAIVESEKTAIISSVYFPNYVWLATGSLHNLNVDKLKKFKGRRIVLFPDTSLKGTAFNIWKNKSSDLVKFGVNCVVSDLLENNATDDEKSKGSDLADYLTKYKISDFLRQSTQRILNNNEIGLNKLKEANPSINKMIEMFDLYIS